MTVFSEGSPLPVLHGETIPYVRTALTQEAKQEGISTGIWECTPGIWRRQVTQREFSHFLAGRCMFTPDNHPPIEIKAGDSVYFPANCLGTWEILEPITKSYLIIHDA